LASFKILKNIENRPAQRMETDFQWFETAINWWKLSVLNKKQSFRLDAFSWGRGPNPREATPLLMTHPLEKRDKSTRVLPKVESHSVIPNFLVVSSSGRHSKICHNLFNRYNLYIYTHNPPHCCRTQSLCLPARCQIAVRKEFWNQAQPDSRPNWNPA
jgi:hypothetical protein